MSEPLAQFWEGLTAAQVWNPEARRRIGLDQLAAAHKTWRDQGALLNAGICAALACDSAIGTGRVETFMRDAIDDLERAIDAAKPASIDAVVGRVELHRVLGSRYFASASTRNTTSAFAQDLATRLDTWFVDAPHASAYAVRGMIYSTDMAGSWDVTEPSGETNANVRSWGSGRYVVQVQSAFNLLLGCGDYASAYALAERYTRSLVTPRLQAWRVAARALSMATPSHDALPAAAAAFEQDKPPVTTEELLALGGSYSYVGLHVWAPYFRARSELALAIERPHSARGHIRAAAQHLPAEISGFVVPGVVQLAVLVHSLVRLLDEGAGLTASEAGQRLGLLDAIVGPDPVDAALLRFLQHADAALDGFRRNPVVELGERRWQDLLAAVDDIVGQSLLGRDVGVLARRELSEQALGGIRGDHHRTWVYSALESIRDERQLQRVVLALIRARAPRYAQIRHGPLEHGKDIVDVEEHEGRLVLRMWQLKCGQISVPIWRAAKHELEVMYDVPLATVNYRDAVDERVGILLFTGHVTPNADPEVAGWIEAQLRERGRRYELWSIDDLVGLIERERLYSVAREALKAEGLPIVR